MARSRRSRLADAVNAAVSSVRRNLSVNHVAKNRRVQMEALESRLLFTDDFGYWINHLIAGTSVMYYHFVPYCPACNAAQQNAQMDGNSGDSGAAPSDPPSPFGAGGPFGASANAPETMQLGNGDFLAEYGGGIGQSLGLGDGSGTGDGGGGSGGSGGSQSGIGGFNNYGGAIDPLAGGLNGRRSPTAGPPPITLPH
jgi:hypothetical protein